MKYFSTRDGRKKITSVQAIVSGLAPDGGLYVPDKIPSVTAEELRGFSRLDYRSIAVNIMRKFLPEFTGEELGRFASRAYGENYDHPDIAPVVKLEDGTYFLELWHGPTCAFKDMALQMLPHLLTASLQKTGEPREVCILVATSGDTGKAALEGFKDIDGAKILVFYPRDGVSEVQKLQMVTQRGRNVGVCAVEGNFDDAQTGVKALFGDSALAAALDRRGYFFSSANSINWGRLLPQIVYYFSSYCELVKNGVVAEGDKINFCVPTGNFGNILAGWYAKEMGLPVNRLICASNENNILTDFIETGTYDRNRNFYTTLSPSMDILVSSNLERLLHGISGDPGFVSDKMRLLAETGRYEVGPGILERINTDFSAGYCGDPDTKKEIASVFEARGYLLDPHTAVAHRVLCDYRDKSGDSAPTVVVSTASPFKFCESVLSSLGTENVTEGADVLDILAQKTGMPIPKPLQKLWEKERRFTVCIPKDKMQSVVREFLS